VLRQAMAPGSDALQEQSWSTADLRDREVRVEVRDGNAGGAYAWLGIGRIDAGPSLRADFRQGLPEGWMERAQPAAAVRTEVVRGGVPFLRYPTAYSVVPQSGECAVVCGFRADRVFVLGGTVPQGKPLEVYGYVDIVYRGGTTDTCPLTYGFTLDQHGKLLSRSPAMHLHESADPFQHYLVYPGV
jgi:hypothetical protein